MKMRVRRSNYLILFDSKALTLKSIYRKKLPDGKYNVYFRFNEIKEHYMAQTDNLDSLNDFKRGDLVTLHLGNAGYFAIDKGNTIPQDGSIITMKL